MFKSTLSDYVSLLSILVLDMLIRYYLSPSYSSTEWVKIQAVGAETRHLWSSPHLSENTRTSD